MDATRRDLILQRWNVIQHELMPELRHDCGALTPKLEKLVHILDWVRIEEWTQAWLGIGRKPHERGALANAFVAKAVLNLATTRAVIERLSMDRALKRLCGFPMWKAVPDEATFSRAFAQFTQARLPERVHEAMVKTYLGDQLIGHISRDGTAIEAREKAAKKVATEAPVKVKGAKARRGRPRKDEALPAKINKISRQRSQSLPAMLEELPRACDRGTKCNAQGYKNSWTGYKLHIDTADCGVPVSALLTSASVHDSQTAVPLATMTAARVTNLYDLMDAAYCSVELQEHSRGLGHVPLIDHNPRGGAKDQFEPADAVRYRERTQAERTNGRLKDEFGGRSVRVRGPDKVMTHLMFGLLVLTADQLMRLLT